MRKIFVDSDYVIDFLRGMAYAKNAVEQVMSRRAEGYLSVVTLFELYVGGLLSANPQKRFEDVEGLLNWFHVVDIDTDITLIAAKIHVDLQKRGLMVGIQDVLIAATAMSRDTELITNNRKHFRNIVGLRLARI